MSKLISELQKREIEELAIQHHDALIAYGADVYRQGLIKGATIASVGTVIAATIFTVTKVIKNNKSEKEES